MGINAQCSNIKCTLFYFNFFNLFILYCFIAFAFLKGDFNKILRIILNNGDIANNYRYCYNVTLQMVK